MRRKAIQHIQFGETTVSYQVVGRGKPVVLVHGLSASMLWWRRNVASLARHHRVFLVDLPGFGTMRHFRDRFALERAINWLIRWFEAVGLRNAHLVGHSMGGYICMAVAGQRPDLVERLVLVAPAVMPHTNSLAGYARPLFHTLRSLKLAFWPILIYDALRAGPVLLSQAAQELLLLQDVSEQMQAVQAPTLIIWGEHDFLVPTMIAPLVHKGIPHAYLLMLKHAGHICMFEQPQVFNCAVLAFLNGETIGNSAS